MNIINNHLEIFLQFSVQWISIPAPVGKGAGKTALFPTFQAMKGFPVISLILVSDGMCAAKAKSVPNAQATYFSIIACFVLYNGEKLIDDHWVHLVIESKLP